MNSQKQTKIVESDNEAAAQNESLRAEFEEREKEIIAKFEEREKEITAKFEEREKKKDAEMKEALKAKDNEMKAMLAAKDNEMKEALKAKDNEMKEALKAMKKKLKAELKEELRAEMITELNKKEEAMKTKFEKKEEAMKTKFEKKEEAMKAKYKKKEEKLKAKLKDKEAEIQRFKRQIVPMRRRQQSKDKHQQEDCEILIENESDNHCDFDENYSDLLAKRLKRIKIYSNTFHRESSESQLQSQGSRPCPVQYSISSMTDEARRSLGQSSSRIRQSVYHHLQSKIDLIDLTLGDGADERSKKRRKD